MLDLLNHLTSLVGPLIGVVNNLRNASSQSNHQRIEAKNAILDAVESTEGYLQHQQEGGQRLISREEKLVDLWRTAGSKLDQVATTPKDKALVKRLRLKARAWEDKEQWPQSRINEARIGFASVKAELLSTFQLEEDASTNKGGFLDSDEPADSDKN